MGETSDELTMIRDSQTRIPDPSKAAKTNAGSVEAYEDLLHRSWQDPDAFWGDVASELEWIKQWDVVRKGELPNFEYFCGGVANPCCNMLDRHLRQGADNKVALIWEGDDFETKFYTYRML